MISASLLWDRHLPVPRCRLCSSVWVGREEWASTEQWETPAKRIFLITTNEQGGYQRVYNEYSDGDYERVFTLSANIDRDRIEATLKDGVLQLVLPKAEAAKARKIELKSS